MTFSSDGVDASTEVESILFVAGARPNFMKIAPLIRELNSRNSRMRPVLVHTGQHYDENMSAIFFSDLDIPEPDHRLHVGGGSHAEQTARIMELFEPVLIEVSPRLVVVVGDVNSTLACTIVAKKLQFPVAHVEAGLRSRDRSMPEEINRVLVDSVADFLFASEPSGLANLAAEGQPRDKLFLVGNVMVDSLFYQLKRIEDECSQSAEVSVTDSEYGVVTLHRPATVDSPDRLRAVVSALEKISNELPLIFPVHPRTMRSLSRFGITLGGNISVLEPLGHADFLKLWRKARIVFTDSGGLQEETSALGVPCVTLRETTERPATVEFGTNQVVGTQEVDILNAFDAIIGQNFRKRGDIPLWDGRAAERIIDILLRNLAVN